MGRIVIPVLLLFVSKQEVRFISNSGHGQGMKVSLEKHNCYQIFNRGYIGQVVRHELIIVLHRPIILFFNSHELYLLFSHIHPIILKILGLFLPLGIIYTIPARVNILP